MLVGNFLAILIGYLQYRFHLIPLDVETYYMATVPIAWDLSNILIINILLIFIISLVLWIPTSIISHINPIKAIRFD
jgi:lipoprotein-releasing system permease protein